MEVVEAASDDEWMQRMLEEEMWWRRREDGWEIQKEIEAQIRDKDGE